MSSEEHGHRSFESMYQETRQPLLAFLLRRTRSADDAADLLAEVYTIAWQQRDGLPPTDRQRLWLFGVARNLLRNHVRRVARHERLAAELQTALSRLPTGEADNRSEVREALSALRPEEQELIQLTAWEGLTPGQIAVVMGRSPGAVRVSLHRARARLRQLLADVEESAGLSDSAKT